ncbi:MAG: CpxP family protein [Vibrio hibernica]
MMNALMKKTVLMLVAAPLTLGSVAAFADSKDHMSNHHGMMGGGQCGMKGEMKIWHQLNLTDAQKSTLKDHRQTDRQAMKADFKAGKDGFKMNHEKMQKLVMAEKFDENAARSLAQDMANKRVEQQVKMARYRHDMFSVLTPEQKQEFSKLQATQHQQCMEKWEKMKEHHEARVEKKAK